MAGAELVCGPALATAHEKTSAARIPLKRLWALAASFTGLKPGANETETTLIFTSSW